MRSSRSTSWHDDTEPGRRESRTAYLLRSSRWPSTVRSIAHFCRTVREGGLSAGWTRAHALSRRGQLTSVPRPSGHLDLRHHNLRFLDPSRDDRKDGEVLERLLLGPACHHRVRYDVTNPREGAHSE